MKKMNIKGIIPPIVTLYKKSGEIHEKAIRDHIDFLIENGVHGIFSMGSTGEFAYLSDEERKAVLKITVDQVNGRVPVIAGISSPSVKLAINWGKYVEDVGSDAAMAILPAYFPVTKKEIYTYFETLSNGINLPLFLYYFPTITNYQIKAGIIQKLAENDLIIGVKETVMTIDHVKEVIELVNDPNFIVLVGVDPLLKTGLELGAKGAILGSSNFTPKLHSELYNAFKNKDQKFDELYVKFNKIIVSVLQYASPIQNSVALTKEAMKILGRNIETSVRSPLPSLSEKIKKRIEKALNFLKD